MKIRSMVMKLPLLEQLRYYQPSWIKSDIAAGLSVAAVSLPSAIAYPAIVGLPVQTGLFAAIFSMLGYALIGPSPRLMIGPDTGTCIMLAGVLTSLNLTGMDRVAASQVLTIMVGMLCFIAGATRLGLIANFLSRPMLVGFLTGISVSLMIGQLPRLTGVPISSSGLISPIVEFIRHLAELHWPTLFMATGSFILARLLQLLRPGLPAPLIVICLAIALAAAFDLRSLEIPVVGALPEISFTLTWPHASLSHLSDLFGGALAVMLVGFGSGIVTARSFAMKMRRDVDADEELLGFGAANLISGLAGGFAVSASDSRTAVNFAIGGKTQLTGLISSACIALTVLFIGEVLAYLPTATLGAILVSAAIDLIDIKELRQIRRISPKEFLCSIVTALGVVIVGVLQGILLAVAVTFILLLWAISRPRIALLGQIPGNPALVKLHRYPEAKPIPGMTIVMIQAAMLFFNADYLKQNLLQIAAHRSEPTAWLVLDAAAINMLDSSALGKLDELREELAALGIVMCLSELNTKARQAVERSGLAERIGADKIFNRTEAAVDAYLAQLPAKT